MAAQKFLSIKVYEKDDYSDPNSGLNLLLLFHIFCPVYKNTFSRILFFTHNSLMNI